MEPVVQVHEIHRRFDNVHAVCGVSFQITSGQVVGFIGANGAGKTTTMRIMASLDVPDAGSVQICGHDTVEEAALVHRKIGWMPDAYGTYEVTTVVEYLDFFARAYGYRGSERRMRVKQVMQFTELEPLAARYIDTLSKGMGQRLCLGRTLLHDPEVLILDEPAAGLDPKARVEFKHLVRLLASEGKTIFISSHILSELEDMCDSLVFIDSGKIVHVGSADALRKRDSKNTLIDIKVCGDPEQIANFVMMQPGLRVLESIRGGFRIEMSGNSSENVADVLRRLIQAGIPVFEFVEQRQKLEDAFIEMVEKLENGRDPTAKR